MEARNYILVLSSVLIAALTVYSMFHLFPKFGGKNQKVRAVRAVFMILIAGAGLSVMHLLGMQTLSKYAPDSESLFLPLTLYVLTLAGMLFLFSRLRQLLAEREQLKELAYRDSLIGLLNKNGMDHFWDHCKPNEQLAVLFLDLNRFKAINDTLGHHVGDLLLKAVGTTLSQFSSKGKRHIFRIGGDEFVIIAKHCSRKDAEQLALRILEKTTRNYKLEKHELFVSASIGITMSHGRIDRQKLLNEADSAMYNAKQLGSGRYSLHKQGQSASPSKPAGSSGSLHHSSASSTNRFDDKQNSMRA
ncbi:GGDEF domain-containing protein [Paenibacillus jilunlii]|uniref:Diguanylate cyclase (GGDEF) domain-containing protein n=1 Tax=Paenibacillus jilunlii TaxID=682956 RepID=A0A1G9XZ89_9BACL|nr:GGDEF domain-containing protein [Paenibacillus jilunlii]SDN01485.1 diguanylate cyclase (GGDEF) domain-containing protein [Paenibacillus jilunlii]